MVDARVRIVSNPYTRSISFDVWDGVSWQPITSESAPSSGLIAAEITHGFFPFKADQIVRLLYEEYEAQDGLVSILFEGPEDEYEELADICDTGDLRGHVNVEELGRHLLNARDILPDMRAVFDSVWPVLQREASETSVAAGQLHQMMDDACDCIPLCVLGNYSAGKSTFVNALIGCELLPTGDEPVTARVYKIMRSRDEGSGIIAFSVGGRKVCLRFNEGGPMTEFLPKAMPVIDEIMSAITSYETSSLVSAMNATLSVINECKCDDWEGRISDTVEVTVPFSQSDPWWGSHEFVIFDTPGSNSASNDEHSRVLRDAMTGLSNGIPIYVAEYDTLDSTDNKRLFEDIHKIEEIDERFTMIVVNKADAANIRLRDFDEEKRRQILEWTVPANLYAQGIFFVSSVMGLGTKIDGELRDEMLAETYYDKRGKYANPKSRFYKRLYAFNILPSQIQKRVEEMSVAAQDLVLANSGLYCLETELGRFADRYSAYEKCQRISRIFSMIVGEREGTLHSMRENLRESKSMLQERLGEQQQRVVDDLDAKSKPLFDETVHDYTLYVDKSTTARKWSISTRDLRKTEQELLWSCCAQFGIAPETVRGNTKWLERLPSDVRDKLQRQVGFELINHAERMFAEAYDSMTSFMREKSRLFWEERIGRIRRGLLSIAAESHILSSENQQRVKDLVLNYSAPDVSPGSTSFDRDGMLRTSRFLIFFKLTSNEVDIEKLRVTYNERLEKALSEIKQSVRESHQRQIELWLESFLMHINDNLCDYNQDIHLLTEAIEKKVGEIARLSSELETLQDANRTFVSLVGWQN